MAQQPGKTNVKIEDLLLSHQNLSTTFVWSFTNDNRFIHAKFGTIICTANKSFAFKLDQNRINAKVSTDWYLQVCPNGRSNKHPKGDFDVALALTKIPGITDCICIKSMTVYRRFEIPQIGLRNDSTNIYKARTGLGWYWKSHILKLSDLIKYPSVRNGYGNGLTFDIKVSITITNVKIERRVHAPSGTLSSSSSVTLASKRVKNENENCKQDMDKQKLEKKQNQVTNEILLNKLTTMEFVMNKMMTKMEMMSKEIANMNVKLAQLESVCGGVNSKDVYDERKNNVAAAYELAGRCDSNISNNSDGNNVTINKFRQWILSVFDNNDQIGNEYIELIVNKQGFDDMKDFIELSELDLKEIGINKKGHRLKLIKGMRQYHDEHNFAHAHKSQLTDTEGR